MTQLQPNIFDRIAQRQGGATLRKFGIFDRIDTQRSFGIFDAAERNLDDDNIFSSLGKGVAQGALRMYRGLAGMSQYLPGMKIANILTKGKTKEQITGAAEKAEQWARELQPVTDTMGEKAAHILGQIIPSLAASVATAGAGGLPAMMGMVFATEGGNAYLDAKERGAPEWRAQGEMLTTGIISALLEKVQIGRLLKFSNAGKHTLKNFTRLARQKAFKSMGKEAGKLTAEMVQNGVEQAIQEFLQEGVQIGSPLVWEGYYRQKPDGSPDYMGMLNQAFEAGLAGGLGGTVFGGLGSLSGLGGLGSPSKQNFENLSRTIQESGISDFEKGRLLTDLNEMAVDQGQTPIDIPKAQQEAQSVARRLEKVLREREVHRPEQTQQIAAQTAQRWAEFEEMLKKVSDPQEARLLALARLKGGMKLKFDPVKFSRADMDVLYEGVRSSRMKGTDKEHLFEALDNVFLKHELPEPAQLKQMDKFFGTNIHEVWQKNLPQSRKAWGALLDTLNLPRAFLASFDFSAALRQGWWMLPTSPRAWGKGVIHGYRAWVSPRYADFVDMQIRTDPMFEQFDQAGGQISEPGGGVKGEDVFISRLAHHIPGIKASERSFVTALNSMRFYAFKNIAQKWQGTGKTRSDYRQLAKFINHATGRGDLKLFKKDFEHYAPLFNVFFFAPRLTAGRFQVIGDLIKSNSPVRKIIAKDLIEALGGGLTLLTLASLAGAKVEKDPASSDFGKIRMGQTRIDIWGGHQQLFRFVYQIMSGQRKSTTTGRKGEIDRRDVLWRFLQSKLSPAVSLAVDLWTGQNFQGERMRTDPEFVARETYQRSVPLFIQDLMDAVEYEGYGAMAMVAPLASHGVGAMTYPERASGQAAKLKNHYAQSIFQARWDDIGPEAQKALRNARPDIQIAEERARIESENLVRDSKMLEATRQSSAKLRRSLPFKVRKEMDRLTVRIPGLSRQVSGKWYLTPERYKDYQQVTQERLEQVLSMLTSLPQWDSFSETVQRALLEEGVKTAKEMSRNQIVSRANLADIQRLSERGNM